MSYVGLDSHTEFTSMPDGGQGQAMDQVHTLQTAEDEVEADDEPTEAHANHHSEDSSEEEEEDEEAVRRVREGFIVDEDEEEEEEDDEEERRRRKKRRKHKHRRREEVEEDLDEDDLELLEENTGGRIGRARRLTRLRRGRDSESPLEESKAKRREVVESSDEDLDEANIVDSREARGNIQNIWDDDRRIRDDDEDMDMDMDDFIDDEEDEEEGAGAMAEEEREERRRERRRLEKERRQALRSRPELTGIDANAWDEIYDVFGDGHDYDWALVGDDEEATEDPSKVDMRYQDVFEPSEIKARLLTEDDDLIRAQDVPERMQLATSTLSLSMALSFPEPLSEQDCLEAAGWVTQRLPSKEDEYFKPSGIYHHLLPELVKAVNHALDYMLTHHLEVPYIFAHRRDYISHFQDQRRLDLLTQNELWTVYMLGQKYRSLLQRRSALQGTYERLGVSDAYYEEQLRHRIDSVEGVADVTQWLGMKYKRKQASDFDIRFHDDDESLVKKHKSPSRISAYEVAKASLVSKLADAFGIQPQEVVINFITSGNKVTFVEDPDLPPLAYAERFADPDPSKALPAEELLRQARMILSTELGSDPILRQEMRKLFKARAVLSVQPTERGKNKIDDYHRYNNFKYLLNKPISEMLEKPQFLHIIEAESQHLITLSMVLPTDVKHVFQNKLVEAFSSDSFSDTAKAWNQERALAVQDAVEKHLLPAGVKWARGYIREAVEENLVNHCANGLYERINVLPYQVAGIQKGDVPSVCAISWGKGDPKKDEISVIILDDAGRLREQVQFENLQDSLQKADFKDLLKRRKPDVIVVGGMSIHTTRLVQEVKKLVKGTDSEPPESNGWDAPEPNDQALNIPVIYVHDDVARIYQHSKRADEEFSTLSQTAKYCVGLARYTQSPLNEFAALGSDITAITFDEEAQNFVPKEKLLFGLEHALVDVVNKIGVDINRAVNDSYYAHLLPYVAGLGPRKAQVVVRKIASMGGNLINREQFIKSGILTTKIFMNAAGFLRIAQDTDYKEARNRSANFDYSNSPDPLDDTRIHPEDYELARKMATDALELDEEDVHDEHPSYVVSTIMKDDDNEKKLDELNLEDFAISMEETNHDLKRHTLGVIRNELLNPFADSRSQFVVPSAWEVLTMLTGETARTLSAGSIVSVLTLRIKPNYIIVRLDSGIEGVINAKYLADEQNVRTEDLIKRGQTIQGVIIEVKLDLEQDQFSVELSSRASDVALGDGQVRRVKPDDYYDDNQAHRDLDLQQRKKRAEKNRNRRVIKHPNFHNFTSQAAEAFLDTQHVGDVVIRPSSKGPDHLAVTWKVADRLFQHIDVHEPNADPTGQIVGNLVVDKHEYADLDELIVNHVGAMARRVEELMAHEKFKKDEDELNRFLTDFVAMNPSKSIYGFTLDRKHPGHFRLSFLAKKGSVIQTWPVRVAPEAYYLFNASVAGVLELCDAFKLRHLHESQNMSGAGAGGKTPYGAGRMTPGRTPGRMTPGHMTPGRMSVRQPARTPNPYSTATAPTPFGGVTPAPQTYGYQAPTAFPGSQIPAYPSHASMQPGMQPGRPLVPNTAAPATAGWTPGGGGRW